MIDARGYHNAENYAKYQQHKWGCKEAGPNVPTGTIPGRRSGETTMSSSELNPSSFVF